ncbi:MAG: hypothetical protein K2M75_07070 [Clostridia bacterium]|nr:hypothetical protein [Clostridia bacterium]
MISLIGALTLTVKLYICIAVFAVLIVAELLALVMLVKWKKNFKKSVANKEAENTQSALEDTPQADDNALTQEQNDAQIEEEISMQTEETQDTEEIQETVEESQEVESEPVETVGEDGEKPSDNKWSAFAFAPLMLLSASAQVATLRYVLYALIGASVLLAAVVLITALAFSKSLTKAPKQKAAKQPAQELVQETAQEEPQPVEEPAEEVAEPVAEEQAVEEVEESIVEDELTVEESVEEEAAEEAVEEGPIEDEIVEEEPIVEEEEELVAEEEPEIEEEQLVAEEEPVVEEEAIVAEEAPVREETVFVVEKPIPMFVKPKLAPEKKEERIRERTVVIDNVTYTMRDDRYLFNPAENDWYIVLTKTFTAKLIQSEDRVKDYYTELKNELLSYKKVHARMSKKRESFNFGRTCLARLTIRGKTLRLHLALDANDYAETKYLVEDTSSVKSLADTPLMYRIKNDRRLKYAKDLIAAVMAQVGAVKQEIEPVNYTEMYPYEETEPLIERNLITRKWYQGRVPEDKGFDFAKKSFKAKLIQSEEIVKEYYSILKNRLLSYRKVNDRMSKARESFRFGRACVARMSIRGKTLKLYLALNPEDYVDTKYKFEDASDVKSVADTPFLMKIKNPRRLKYALELIDEVMENFGTKTKRDIDELDYAADLPFESTEDLMEKGLVVNVHVKSNSFMGQRLAMRAKLAEDEAAADEDND